MQWFDIDRKGLAKILARKGKAFAALELLQNAWDQDVQHVSLTITKAPGSRIAELKITDDDPEGFADLADTFTLFAESRKKANPTKRGRFNVGEKMVLALCEEAEIRTVKGTVTFNATGRHRSRKGTEKGSVFTGRLRMTNDEVCETLDVLTRVIVPSHITTTVNGTLIEPREPESIVEATLATEIADEDGYLRPSRRKTEIAIYAVGDGEAGMLFEMGIPVVETGDDYHADIQQKLPVSLERDNVPAAYLRSVRVAVLNERHDRLSSENATSAWVRDALGDVRCSAEAAKSAVAARFGDKSCAYDPSDPEANKLAVSRGYTVVHGGSLSKGEWANARESEALLPAGQICPSPRPFSKDPNAPTLKLVSPGDWSVEERARIGQLRRLAGVLIGKSITVRLADDPGWPFNAAYGETELTLNRAALGRQWFCGPVCERVLSLLIHELGHDYEGDHLSAGYHEALCGLGARLALNAATNPAIFAEPGVTA